MQNKKITRKWRIVYISEKKYNFYEKIDPQKMRPVLIWNDASNLKNIIIAIYCTSKYTEERKKFLLKIRDKNTRKLKKDTYLNFSKIFFINKWDINWKNNAGDVKDIEIRKEITERMNEYFCK